MKTRHGFLLFLAWLLIFFLGFGYISFDEAHFRMFATWIAFIYAAVAPVVFHLWMTDRKLERKGGAA